MLITCPSGNVFSSEHERFVTAELGVYTCPHCLRKTRFVTSDPGYRFICEQCGHTFVHLTRYKMAGHLDRRNQNNVTPDLLRQPGNSPDRNGAHPARYRSRRSR